MQDSFAPGALRISSAANYDSRCPHGAISITRFPIADPSFSQARPRDSWVICGSALGLIEKAVEFAAGRIEGALLLFRAVVDQWAAVGPNRITNKFLGRDLS